MLFTPHPSSRTLPFVPDFYYKRVVDVPNGTGKLTGPGATLKNGTGEMNGNGSDLKKFPSNAGLINHLHLSVKSENITVVSPKCTVNSDQY